MHNVYNTVMLKIYNSSSKYKCVVVDILCGVCILTCPHSYVIRRDLIQVQCVMHVVPGTYCCYTRYILQKK